jgi:hypothetical protein
MRKIMFAAALAAAASPAIAQVNTGSGNGLVAVNIQNVDILNNFLNDTQIAALNNLTVPITVQAPVSVAAAVCGVSVPVLAQQKSRGDNDCDATSGSGALARLVADQLLDQKMKKK